MKPFRALALALALLACAACAGPRRPIANGSGGGSADTGAVAELLEVDRQFAQDAVALGLPEAFARYADAGSLRVTPEGPMPQGAEAFRQSMSRLHAGARLLWVPRQAEVSRGGDLGWTLGDYKFLPPAGGGGQASHGRYVTVWRRTGRGPWRIAVDVGTEAP